MRARSINHLPSSISFLWLAAIASLTAALLPSCGGTGDDGPQTTAGSSSAQSSVTSSSSSSGGDPPPLCQKSSVGLQGSLDGTDVAASYPLIRTRVKGSIFQAFFQNQGHAVIFGENDLEQPGSSAKGTGLLRMPDEGPSPGEWFCAGVGSNVTIDTQKTFTLASLARLGACPNNPVSGEVDGCLGGDINLCPKGKKLASTLAGAEFDWTSNVTGWGGMPGLYEIYLDNGGLIELYIDLDTVKGGLLYIAPGSSDAGALYCIGGGSLQPGGQAVSFTLSNMSRLGTCADAKSITGSLDGCAQ